MYSPDGGSKTDLGFPRVSCTPVEMCAVDSNFPGRAVPRSIGFHEVLLHDMEEENLPFVALSELDCLRQSWPKPLFVFMSRYQHDLERMRIALFHMELAHLWRCPVTWCTVWKGTAQDCVDHLRKTHEISQTVKAANLARYFPPWTVTRSQWSEMTRPAISVGRRLIICCSAALGSPCFTAIGSSVVGGTHVASRGTYMRGAGSSCASDMVTLPPAEAYTVQALMDLALPRCVGLGDGPRQVHAPWVMSTDSPASPAASRLDTSGEED